MTLIKTPKKITNGILFTIGVFLFLYTAYRAYVLSFTWDESFSYLQYIRNGILFPKKYEMMDANNHLLNTWLDIHLIRYFGISEFVLRLPSLFSHLLFLVFSFKLVRGFQNSWLVLASFLIINLNPYMLDFFSLSRGYGLSLGLMMTSIYYLYAFHMKENKTKYAVVSIVFGLLASLANFVVLNYFLVSSGLIFLLIIYNAFQSSETTQQKAIALIKALILPLLITALSLWMIIPIALKLKAAGALFYGGNKGFWPDTFCTVADRCLYELGYNNWFLRLAKGFVLLILLLGTCFTGIKYIRKQVDKSKRFLGSLLLLIGLCVLSTIVQHRLLGTLYLIDRTALFLVVLFNLVLVFFINELAKENNKAAVVSYLAAAVIVFHFILSFNLLYVLEWKSDANTKQMIVDLKKIKVIPKEKMNVSICIPLAFDQSINFYRALNNENWINTVERSKTVDLRNDYLYLEPEQLKDVNTDSIEIIKRYPVTNTVLVKPKFDPNLTKVCFIKMYNYADSAGGKYTMKSTEEYGPGLSYIISDSLTPDRNAEVTFKATVMAPNILTCNLNMVISFENKQGLYLWRRAYIKDYIKKQGEWTDVFFSCMVPKETKLGDELKSYIWNSNKDQLCIKKMEFKWLNATQ